MTLPLFACGGSSLAPSEPETLIRTTAPMTTAAETAEANGIDLMKYTVYTGDILSEKELRQAVLRRSYDIVLANIVANVIIALAPLVPYMMHKDSKFIASGIIEDRLDEVIKALEDNGLTVKEVLTGEDWRALEAELK